MQTTNNYGLKKPESNEYISVNDLNYNADKIDEELVKKVDFDGGDISDTKVGTITDSTAAFPTPAQGDTQKTLWGKIKKWQQDCMAKFGNYVLMSMITNQQVNSTNNIPTSALVYAMQQVITANSNAITQLNSDKAPAIHTHDDRYYTESEVSNLMNENLGRATYSSDLFLATNGKLILLQCSNS